MNFIFDRKKSELIVNVTTKADEGAYECKVKNKVDKQTESKVAKVIVTDRTPMYSSSSNMQDEECDFCHNGGHCILIKEFGEQACR